MRRRFKSKKQAGLVLGYRSGLEESISKQLKDAKRKFDYESEKIHYEQPAKKRSYKPDFILVKKNGTKMFIETKGRLMPGDRQKHEWIAQQHPELDLRFVFSNSSNRISKGSKTTYADWCVKNGFKFADKEIPNSWLLE